MKTKLFLLVLPLLLAACSHEEPVITPNARFSYTTTDLTVTFTNQSSNAVSYSWDFGDNSAVSTRTSPSHTYSKTGSYNVTLTAKSSTGHTDKFSQSITLVANAVTSPNASFNYSPLKPFAQQEITLTNNSTNASSYLWDFGNNTTSTLKNPTINYEAGTWTVTLTAFSADKSLKDVSTKTINVMPAPKVMKITSYRVNSIDFEDTEGRYWDGSSKDGPDIFLDLYRDGTDVDLEESTYKSNVSSSDLPYTRTLGWRLSYFSSTYTIYMKDYDSFLDANDVMCKLSFIINNYIPQYPSEITLKTTNEKFSVTLFIEWEAE